MYEIATVVGTDRKSFRSRKKTRHEYCPVVEFTANGVLCRATVENGSAFPGKYKEGQSLDIRYNPSNPEEIILKGKEPAAAIAGGLFLIVIGVLGFYFKFR